MDRLFNQDDLGKVVEFTTAAGAIRRAAIDEVNRYGWAKAVYLLNDGTLSYRRTAWINPKRVTWIGEAK